MGVTVAIIGGGNGARTMAADFADRGMSVRLWEHPKFFNDLGDFARTRRQKVWGALTISAEIDMVTTDMKAALDGADFVCVVVPSFAYKSVAENLKGVISKKQPLLIYPGAFASLVFKKELGEDAPEVMVDVCNLPYGTRVMPDGRIHCIVVNPVNCAFFPASAETEWLEKIRVLHPFVRTYSDVIENGLHIINPVAHTGSCLFNVAQVEQKFRGPYWTFAYLSPSCAAITGALDHERDLIGLKMGYPHNTCLSEFYGKPDDYVWDGPGYYSVIRSFTGVDIQPGPADLEHRYYTEDCGFGLVPWSCIAKTVGVEVPVMDSIITIYSLIHQRDWRKVGRTLEDMGLDGLNAEEMREYARTGIRK